MDSSCFYSQGDPLFRPQGLGIGFSPVAHEREDPPYVEHSDIGLGQKIDQNVYLVHQQAQKRALIKEELCSLRADMKELQDTISLCPCLLALLQVPFQGPAPQVLARGRKYQLNFRLELLCLICILDIIDTGSCESSA